MPDSGSDTHDDFKPKYKEPPADNVEDTIKNDVSTHKVFLYMKVGPTGDARHAGACIARHASPMLPRHAWSGITPGCKRPTHARCVAKMHGCHVWEIMQGGRIMHGFYARPPCMRWRPACLAASFMRNPDMRLQGVPEAPQCGFSNMACRILDAYGEPLDERAAE